MSNNGLVSDSVPRRTAQTLGRKERDDMKDPRGNLEPSMVEVHFSEKGSLGIEQKYTQVVPLSEAAVYPLTPRAIDSIIQSLLDSKPGDTGFLGFGFYKTAEAVPFAEMKKPILIWQESTQEYYMGLATESSEKESHYEEEGVLLASRFSEEQYGTKKEGVQIWLLAERRLSVFKFSYFRVGGGTTCASEFDKDIYRSSPARVVQYDSAQGFFRVLS